MDIVTLHSHSTFLGLTLCPGCPITNERLILTSFSFSTPLRPNSRLVSQYDVDLTFVKANLFPCPLRLSLG
jgi:hypothetical protein